MGEKKIYKEKKETLRLPDDGKKEKDLSAAIKHAGEFIEVNTDLIVGPLNPHRIAPDDGYQHDLEKSIRKVGILHPLVIVQKEGSFEVVAGDRRLKAARTIGLVSVPARVVKAEEMEMERIRLHENMFREEVNRVDLAVALGKLKKRHGSSNRELAVELGVSEQYIGETIKILRWPSSLVATFGGGHISYSAARELSHIEDEKELEYYLRAAEESGCTPRLAKAWRATWEAAKRYPGQTAPESEEEEPAAGSAPSEGQCFLCGKMAPFGDMVPVWLHGPCRSEFITVLRKYQESR